MLSAAVAGTAKGKTEIDTVPQPVPFVQHGADSVLDMVLDFTFARRIECVGVVYCVFVVVRYLQIRMRQDGGRQRITALHCLHPTYMQMLDCHKPYTIDVIRSHTAAAAAAAGTTPRIRLSIRHSPRASNQSTCQSQPSQ